MNIPAAGSTQDAVCRYLIDAGASTLTSIYRADRSASHDMVNRAVLTLLRSSHIEREDGLHTVSAKVARAYKVADAIAAKSKLEVVPSRTVNIWTPAMKDYEKTMRAAADRRAA